MSRCIVFNESVMFIDNSFTDVISDNYDKEQQHISIQVELMDDQETEIVDNDVYDTVQHSSPILQPEDLPIALPRTKRSCGPPACYIEECNMVHYALNCAEQVENTHEPATYSDY